MGLLDHGMVDGCLVGGARRGRLAIAILAGRGRLACLGLIRGGMGLFVGVVMGGFEGLAAEPVLGLAGYPERRALAADLIRGLLPVIRRMIMAPRIVLDGVLAARVMGGIRGGVVILVVVSLMARVMRRVVLLGGMGRLGRGCLVPRTGAIRPAPPAVVAVVGAPVPGLGFFLFPLVFLAGHGGLFGQQRLAILDRDAVVVRMDLAEGEEAVPVPAIFDEGGLERGLHPRDLG